ncbi:Ferredoxin [Pseudomonas sp. NFACC02]|jgi:ferredoxin|uniref:ferredoxin n=1 Tax=Pseudomonas sp. NFACC02 TaxID=1566250 RepID=UPI0008BC79BA|nr:ferredoxin [Pseudomonas sp. NFACC02]SEQ40985.1 Ferredoxin [Pseudomonas sp. NFACC02]
MRLKIDQSLCVGGSACVNKNPTRFSLDDDNVAVVSEQPILESEIPLLKEIVDDCPMQAISLI